MKNPSLTSIGVFSGKRPAFVTVLIFFCLGGKQCTSLEHQAVPIVQFLYNETSVCVSQRITEVPVIRSGDPSSLMTVTCVAQFQPRGHSQLESQSGDWTSVPTSLLAAEHVHPYVTQSSTITFSPDETVRRCKVTLPWTTIGSDSLVRFKRPVNEYVVSLTLLDPITTSSSGVSPVLGPNRNAIVRVRCDGNEALLSISSSTSLPWSLPSVQFQQSAYTVQEPLTPGDVSTIRIQVSRSSEDPGVLSMVRIVTQDVSALATIDYRPKSQMITFRAGESFHMVELEILPQVLQRDVTEVRLPKFFRVVFLPEGLRNARLGANASATVTILPRLRAPNSAGSFVFPLPPMVVSLLAYHRMEFSAPELGPTPGYPLICVTPCDPKFPGHDRPVIVRKFCAEMNSKNVSFSWEVSRPAGGTVSVNGSRTLPSNHFVPLTESNVFARVDAMVLDSIFFREGYSVSCVVSPVLENGRNGFPSRSKPVVISGSQTIPTLCQRARGVEALGSKLPLRSGGADTDEFQFHSSFFTSLRYLGFEDKEHPNRLHIHVEIPHQDNMLPLVSTSPLHDVELLLSDSAYRQHHVCSNLILPDERQGILGDGLLKGRGSESTPVKLDYPYQFNSTLRGKNTVLLYQHLDFKKCTWTFDSWYHIAELVDLCGGRVLSDSQMNQKSFITVRVPLYVSYVFPSALTSGWTSVEHHTEMEFSFFYSSVIWQPGLEMENRKLAADVQIIRILLGDNGQLIIYFQTLAKFRGVFVLHHPLLPEHQSRVIPPSHLVALTFNLTLLRSARTYDRPIQTWRAISSYSLKDYTGNYVFEMIPCTVSSTQKFPKASLIEETAENLLPCTPHSPERVTLPIAFRQANRPVPVVYSLNTDFQLMNSKQLFMSDPRELQPSLQDFYDQSTFLKGQIVYGRVLWHPDQDLSSAYQLQIQKVYVCTGRDGYLPSYDPSGNEYNEGPQFGCIQPSRKLKHRLLILNRRVFQETDHAFADSLEAKFAEQDSSYRTLKTFPGVDGFFFKVDGLYNLDSSNQWFIQVLYTIKAAHGASRMRRFSRGAGRQSTDGSFDKLHIGTNMRPLPLSRTEMEFDRNYIHSPIRPHDSTAGGTPVVLTVLLMLVMAAIGVTSALILRYYRENRHRRCSRSHMRDECSTKRCLFERDAAAVKVVEITSCHGCIVKIQRVPLTCFSKSQNDVTEV